MKNSADLGGCYPPRPSASVNNTLLDLQNSSYPTQPHSINIILFSSVTPEEGCVNKIKQIISKLVSQVNEFHHEMMGSQ